MLSSGVRQGEQCLSMLVVGAMRMTILSPRSHHLSFQPESGLGFPNNKRPIELETPTTQVFP